MYTYSTIPELIALLDKHWNDNETFSLHYKHNKKYDLIEFTLLQNGNILYEFVCSVENIHFPIRIWKTLEELPELKMFLDRIYQYEYKSLEQEVLTGDDIELSSHVMVSDPCYDTDTWCNADLHNVRPGTWHTKALYKDGLCTDLVVWHKDMKEPTFDKYEKTSINVGVDSGQAGVYDYDHFAKNCKNEEWYDSMCTGRYVPNKPLSNLERRCRDELLPFLQKEHDDPTAHLEWCVEHMDRRDECRIKYDVNINDFNSNGHMSGYEDTLATDAHSVVTHAGYGDGVYDCFVARRKNGELIAIRINFIDDSENED